MKTWLFTWNPKLWRWDDKYYGHLETFTGHEEYDSLKPYIAITEKTRKNLMTTMFSK